MFSTDLFSQKNSIIDVWKGRKYVCEEIDLRFVISRFSFWLLNMKQARFYRILLESRL